MSYIRLTSVADQRKQPPSQASTDETVWEAGFRIVNGYGNDSVANVQIVMPQRGNLKVRMGDYVKWLQLQCGICAKHGKCKMSISSVDMSGNDLVNRDVKLLAQTVLTVCPKVRVLKLYDNKLSDPAPFLAALRKGHLRELHLSGNMFSTEAAGAIIAAAATAKNEDDTWMYPSVVGDVPLWLRLENQHGVRGGAISGQALREIVSAGRDPQKAVCIIDGTARTRWCQPAWCACVKTQPAMHVCYMTDTLGSVPKPVGRVQKSDNIPAKQTTVAPWHRSKLAQDSRRATRPPSMNSTEDFPPLPTRPATNLMEETKAEAGTDVTLPPGIFDDDVVRPRVVSSMRPPLSTLPCKILRGNMTDMCLTMCVVDVAFYDAATQL